MIAPVLNGLTNAERLVIVAAARHEPVSVRFVPQAQRLAAMHLIDEIAPESIRPATHRIVWPTASGYALGRAYIEQQRGDVWRALAEKLSKRAADAPTPTESACILKFQRRALQRSMEAAMRCARALEVVGNA